MAKKLFADGVSGDVAIFDPANPAALSNPLENLGSVYFHSALSYMAIVNVATITIDHPERARSGNINKYGSGYNPTYGSETYDLAEHTLGYIPHGILYTGDNMLPSATPIQMVGRSFRAAVLKFTDAKVQLHESFYTFDETLPPVSLTYKALVFRRPSEDEESTTLFISPTQMIASRGKLNTDHRYVQSHDSPGDAPDFFFTAAKTADVQNGAMKMVTANGTVIEDPDYTGAFDGGNSRGCKA